MQSKKLDRAKQFMPFAALRGYYDLIRQCEKIKEPKRELSHSEADILSDKINKLQKGMLINLKYYDIDGYRTISGYVSCIDKDFRFLTVIKTKINFDDIIEIFD